MSLFLTQEAGEHLPNDGNPCACDGVRRRGGVASGSANPARSSRRDDEHRWVARVIQMLKVNKLHLYAVSVLVRANSIMRGLFYVKMLSISWFDKFSTSHHCTLRLETVAAFYRFVVKTTYKQRTGLSDTRYLTSLAELLYEIQLLPIFISKQWPKTRINLISYDELVGIAFNWLI